MKKSALLLSLFFLSIHLCFANDTYFFVSGGNLIPSEESNTLVQMKSEVISIVCESKYYEVTVDFNFYNSGKTAELLVGFPFFEAGIDGHGKIYDFQCWTNDELTDFSDMPLDRKFSNNDYHAENLQNAYTRKIVFPKKATTKTRVKYKSEYGEDTSGYIVKYLYGTGSSWNKSIEDIELVIENNLSYSIPQVLHMNKTDISNNFIRISDNKWSAHFTNVEPEYTECFSVNLGDLLGDSGPKAFSKSRFVCCRQKLNKNDLFWYTKPQLRILRNTIFALNGYSFKSQDLKDFFAKRGQYWYPKYEINPDFAEEKLSEVERFNIDLIYVEENRR